MLLQISPLFPLFRARGGSGVPNLEKISFILSLMQSTTLTSAYFEINKILFGLNDYNLLTCAFRFVKFYYSIIFLRYSYVLFLQGIYFINFHKKYSV